MRTRLILAALMLCTAAAAASPCDAPPPVADYLKAHPRWSVVDMSDLDRDEKAIWAEAHKGQCPGIAAVKLDESGATSYALELRDRRGDLEQLVVLQALGGRFKEVVLERPFRTGGLVVWRSPPGRSGDMYTRRRVRIVHDSIIWERMESASQQIYFAGGRFHRLQTGD